MKVYVASSWRNKEQPAVVQMLRHAGHAVYDFRNPPEGLKTGFSWSQIDPDWKSWDAKEYREHLMNHPLCAQSFMSDFRAMRWADACVMVLPCGRSAHTEMGYFTGQGKRTVILMDKGIIEPELMYLQADSICLDIEEVLQVLGPVAK